MVAAIVAGDPEGLAAAYDRYASSLHAYCRSLLAEAADAADAVQDTFIIAASKLGGLRDPDRLRPWLYAVARNECLRRLRARAHSAPLEEAGDVVSGETPDFGRDAAHADLSALVADALAGLNPGDREIIELNLRHELDGADLAGALGVPRNQAHALASRARSQFETALSALLVARSGRGSCAELATILAGWDGQMTVLLRKRVNRHIERCDTCSERKRREFSPAMLLSMLPVVALPTWLRGRVLRLVADTSPGAAAHRADLAARAEPFGRSGFPRSLDPPPPVRGLRGYALTTSAAVIIVAVLGGGSALAAYRLYPHPRPVTSPAAAAASTPPPAPAGVAGTTPATSPSPSPATQAPPPPPSPTPSASPSPSVSPGTLVVSPTTPVDLSQQTPTDPNDSYTGTFTLTARGGPVDPFTIDVPPAYAPYLTVTPATGSIAAGQSVTVTVSAPPAITKLPYETALTVSPGGLTILIHYPPGLQLRLPAGAPDTQPGAPGGRVSIR